MLSLGRRNGFLPVSESSAAALDLDLISYLRAMPDACTERVVGFPAWPAVNNQGSLPLRNHPPIKGTLLIDATCVPADIRYPTDLSPLNEVGEVTDKPIDAKHPQIRECFGDKLHTHRKKARLEFLAVATKKRPRINKICNAIQQQLGHLVRNPASIDALIACGGCLLTAGSHWYHKLLVVSELVRQQKILYR